MPSLNDTATVIITVLDENEFAPTFVSPPDSVNVSEIDMASNELILQLIATDMDDVSYVMCVQKYTVYENFLRGEFAVFVVYSTPKKFSNECFDAVSMHACFFDSLQFKYRGHRFFWQKGFNLVIAKFFPVKLPPCIVANKLNLPK